MIYNLKWHMCFKNELNVTQFVNKWRKWRSEKIKMKVTISFDETKIVVPCGDGDITVRQLTNLAVTRYKKAIGKPNNFWVSVSNLKSCYEGGMLDPDDLVRIILTGHMQWLTWNGHLAIPSPYHQNIFISLSFCRLQ